MLHPAAAQSLLAYRPSRVVPFVAFSVVAHVVLVALAVVLNWVLAPRLINLDQKPIKASLVKLGKPRDEKLLPRKEAEPEAVAPPKAVPIPGLAVEKKPAQSPAKKEDARKQLFDALDNTAKQADDEGKEDGDPNGDAAREEGERYFGLITTLTKRNYDVANVIDEGARRTLKAMVFFRVNAQGQVSDVRLAKASGNAIFDEAVVGAVQKTAPFPPPPPHLKTLQSDGVTLVFTP